MKVRLDSGQVIELGETEATPTISFVDYSRRDTDDYGVTTVVERGFSRRLSVRLIIPFDQADALQRRLADLRATPAQWIADEDFAWLNFRGFYRDFEIDLALPPVSYCTLTIESLSLTEAGPELSGDPAPNDAASTLQLLQPIRIADGSLVSSSVPENDYPEWSAATAYPVGARVIKAATHRIYESRSLQNQGNDPEGASGKWQLVGPTSRWAMFDDALGSTTDANYVISVVINAGAVNAVALLDVVGTLVRVQTAAYDRSVTPNDSGTATFLDMPDTAGQITVTVRGPGAVSVGTLLAGRLVDLGETIDSPKASINDFSRKETDEFGDTTIVQRAWAKRLSLRAMIRRNAIDMVASRIAAVRAKPSLWIGKEGMETLTTYGFCRDFSIEVAPNVSALAVTIEGLSTAGKVEPIAASVAWPDITDPNGTKPQDNATVGAPDGTLVGGLPAEHIPIMLDAQQRLVNEAMAQFSQSAETLIEQTLRGDAFQELLRVRTLIDGKGVNTVLTEFSAEQKDQNDAFKNWFRLLGAEVDGGAGWILNAQGVQLQLNGESFTRSLEQIALDVNGHSGLIEDLRDIVVDPSGATVRSMLRLTNDGYVSGLLQTNGGPGKARVAFLMDSFALVDQNLGAPFAPFSYDDGLITMDNVYVARLKVGAMDAEFILNRRLGELQSTQTLPGGVVMKWGKYRGRINNETTFSIVFEEPFPNACRAITPTPFLTTFSNLRDLWMQNVGEPSRFGATFGTQSSTGDDQRIDGFDWIAFGD